MQALIVEVNEYRVHALQDAIDSPVVKVQETERALVAGLSLDFRHMKHLGQVQDIRVQVDPVHTVSHVAWQVREVSVADVLFDLNILNRRSAIFPSIWRPGLGSSCV